MIIAKMNWFFIFVYHFLLIDVTLAAAIAGDKVEIKESNLPSSTATKATTTSSSLTTSSTTALPNKAEENEGKPEKPQVNAKEEAMEKPLPKKRGVLDELYRVHPENFDETELDGNDEPTPEELFAASHAEPGERPFFRYNDRPSSGALEEGGYFENEGRRKRTVMFDGLYNRPQEYSNSEIELSPDEVMAMLNLLEERRLYNAPVQNHWDDYDNNLGSFESDMSDEERERPGNSYAYESNLDSLEKYPVNAKRYMITRRRRSDFLGNPKLKVPIFRRAIL